MELPDRLPISMLNQLEYCPRRFWLMFVCGEMDVNAPVLEGTQQHERAHGGGTTTEDEVEVRRRVSIGSERLRLVGVADVIEERTLTPNPSPDEETHQARGNEAQLIPIEYKHGRMGKWLNDHVQLCAQAMCLEEQLSRDQLIGDQLIGDQGLGAGEAKSESGDQRSKIAYGEIFYWGSRRRERVAFTPELRARTEATIQRAFDLIEQGEMPPPLTKDLRAKCQACSLQPICLPDEVSLLVAQSGSRIVK
jgi:CRISPR-associated exonuclease Cas4